MAFPTTAVIDDFTRADGAIGANYTIPTFAGSMSVSSNTAVAAAANGLAIRNTLTYQDVEVYATLATKPSDGNIATLFWRTVQVASAITLDGYGLIITSVAGASNDTLQVQSVTNGVGTNIGAAFTQELANGDVIGIRMIGSSIEVFVNGTSLGTRSDSTYTATGQLGLGFLSTSGAWDNFGGGYAEITGTLSVTQAANTLTSAGVVDIVGTLSVTQAANTLTSAATADVVGVLSTTQADNTLSSTATADIVGTLSATQADNTLSASGVGVIVGSASITQADNTLSSVGTVDIVGTASVTQAANTLASTGAVDIVGVLSVTQDANTLSATATVDIVGVLSVTQDANTLSATGTTTDAITGTLSVTQADNTLSSTGLVDVIGTLSVTQAANTLTATATANIDGTLNTTQADNTLSASGTSVIIGSLSVTQSDNTLSSVGTVAIVGVLSVTQDDNTLSSTESPLVAEVEYDALEVDTRNLLLTTEPRQPLWTVTDRDALDSHTIEARVSVLTAAPRNRELKV